MTHISPVSSHTGVSVGDVYGMLSILLQLGFWSCFLFVLTPLCVIKKKYIHVWFLRYLKGILFYFGNCRFNAIQELDEKVDTTTLMSKLWQGPALLCKKYKCLTTNLLSVSLTQILTFVWGSHEKVNIVKPWKKWLKPLPHLLLIMIINIWRVEALHLRSVTFKLRSPSASWPDRCSRVWHQTALSVPWQRANPSPKQSSHEASVTTGVTLIPFLWWTFSSCRRHYR